MTDAAQVPDRVEREVRIAAPVERVWELVRETGWWVEDDAAEGRTVEGEGDEVVVVLPPHGRIPVRRVTQREPEYVAFRWGDEEGSGEGSTLVEFTLRAAEGGTVVRVVESGFVGAYPDAARRDEVVRDNTSGWEKELEVLRTRAERAAA